MNINGLRLDNNGKLDIPAHIENIKIDVGLSWCAPNSARWLFGEDKLFVIGVEPNDQAIKSIKDKGMVWHKTTEVVYNEDNYMLLECALDNVDELQMVDFYHMEGDPGTSSLMKPSPKLVKKQKIDFVKKVPVISLSDILEKIPWDRFEYIEHIKTDAQGKDLCVFMSAGDYIEKVVYLDVEVSTAGHYMNEINENHVVQIIKEKGFKVLKRGMNTTFLNTRYENIHKNIKHLIIGC